MPHFYGMVKIKLFHTAVLFQFLLKFLLHAGVDIDTAVRNLAYDHVKERCHIHNDILHHHA